MVFKAIAIMKFRRKNDVERRQKGPLRDQGEEAKTEETSEKGGKPGKW